MRAMLLAIVLATLAGGCWPGETFPGGLVNFKGITFHKKTIGPPTTRRSA